MRAVTVLHEKIKTNLDNFMVPEDINNMKKRYELEHQLQDKAEYLLMKRRYKMKMIRYNYLKEEINSKEIKYESKNQYIE
jgi:hypothetical protein